MSYRVMSCGTGVFSGVISGVAEVTRVFSIPSSQLILCDF